MTVPPSRSAVAVVGRGTTTQDRAFTAPTASAQGRSAASNGNHAAASADEIPCLQPAAAAAATTKNGAHRRLQHERAMLERLYDERRTFLLSLLEEIRQHVNEGPCTHDSVGFLLYQFCKTLHAVPSVDLHRHHHHHHQHHQDAAMDCSSSSENHATAAYHHQQQQQQQQHCYYDEQHDAQDFHEIMSESLMIELAADGGIDLVLDILRRCCCSSSSAHANSSNSRCFNSEVCEWALASLIWYIYASRERASIAVALGAFDCVLQTMRHYCSREHNHQRLHCVALATLSHLLGNADPAVVQRAVAYHQRTGGCQRSFADNTVASTAATPSANAPLYLIEDIVAALERFPGSAHIYKHACAAFGAIYAMHYSDGNDTVDSCCRSHSRTALHNTLPNSKGFAVHARFHESETATAHIATASTTTTTAVADTDEPVCRNHCPHNRVSSSSTATSRSQKHTVSSLLPQQHPALAFVVKRMMACTYNGLVDHSVWDTEARHIGQSLLFLLAGPDTARRILVQAENQLCHGGAA